MTHPNTLSSGKEGELQGGCRWSVGEAQGPIVCLGEMGWRCKWCGERVSGCGLVLEACRFGNRCGIEAELAACSCHRAQCWLDVPQSSPLLVLYGFCSGQDGVPLPTSAQFDFCFEQTVQLAMGPSLCDHIPSCTGPCGLQWVAVSRCLSSPQTGLAHGGIQNLSFKTSAHDFVRSFS